MRCVHFSAWKVWTAVVWLYTLTIVLRYNHNPAARDPSVTGLDTQCSSVIFSQQAAAGALVVVVAEDVDVEVAVAAEVGS